MQQEMHRQKRHSVPDNDKYKECVRNPVDSNKLALESQTTPSSIKSKKVKCYDRITADMNGSIITCLGEEYKKSRTKIQNRKQYSGPPKTSSWNATNLELQSNSIINSSNTNRKLFRRNAFLCKQTDSQKREGKKNVTGSDISRKLFSEIPGKIISSLLTPKKMKG